MFRLEKILSLRRREEESIREELNKVRLRIREVEEELDKTMKSRTDIENQLRTSQNGAQLGFLLYLLKMHDDYIRLIKNKLDNLRKEEELIFKRYMEKRTERKSFEKLKERYLEYERSETDRKERSVIDEIALQKHFRNMGNE